MNGRNQIRDKRNRGNFITFLKGWTKELNLTSWNGKEPKYDLRDWAPDHSKMGKGITLTDGDLLALRDILNGMNGS